MAPLNQLGIPLWQSREGASDFDSPGGSNSMVGVTDAGRDKELAGLLSSLRAPAQQENAFTTLAALLTDRGAQLGGEKAPGAIDKLMKKRAETEKLNIEKRIQARRLELGDRAEKRNISDHEYKDTERELKMVTERSRLLELHFEKGIPLSILAGENDPYGLLTTSSGGINAVQNSKKSSKMVSNLQNTL